MSGIPLTLTEPEMQWEPPARQLHPKSGTQDRGCHLLAPGIHGFHTQKTTRDPWPKRLARVGRTNVVALWVRKGVLVQGGGRHCHSPTSGMRSGGAGPAPLSSSFKQTKHGKSNLGMMNTLSAVLRSLVSGVMWQFGLWWHHCSGVVG